MNIMKPVVCTFIATSIIFIGLWLSGIFSPFYFAAVAERPRHETLPHILNPAMKVEIEARPIDGLSRNISGLTYSDVSASLFAVVNNPPLIAEISLEGRLLRTIPLKGLKDPEGITHMGGQRFLIADEGDQSLHVVNIDSSTAGLDVKGSAALVLGFGFQHNMGFEGASWDSRSKRLYVAQEMFPIRVLTIDGLDLTEDERRPSVIIKSWALPWLHRLALIDVSSISFHEATGRLFLLSHQSAMVLEFDADGHLVGTMSLRANQLGLSGSIAQAEGLTIGPEGKVFLVAEPNLFFRFSASENRQSADQIN